MDALVLVLAGAGLGPGYQGRLLEEVLGKADMVYVDTYTMPGAEWLIEYARMRSRIVVEARRSVLEDGIAEVIEKARESLVVILVPGDPLIATTHRSIIAEAARRGVKYRVLPGVSGVCAAKTLSLLDYYKYGRTVTVPGPWRMVRAYSVLEYLLENACAGLHTLLLLDISPRGTSLSPAAAVQYLLGLAAEAGIRGLAETPAILVARAGMDGEEVRVYKHLADLSGVGSTASPASIAIPGPLSSYEREALLAVSGIDVGGGLQRVKACNMLRALKEYLEDEKAS